MTSEKLTEAFEEWMKTEIEHPLKYSLRDAFEAGVKLVNDEPKVTLETFQTLKNTFDTIIASTRQERDEADKSAGTAWRMLRRYKFRVRHLLADVQKALNVLNQPDHDSNNILYDQTIEAREILEGIIENKTRKRHMTYDHPAIYSLTGRFRFLSNFWKAPFFAMEPDGRKALGGHKWDTVEHAYQAAKSLDPLVWGQVYDLPTPGEAKRFGQQIDMRPNFEEYKLLIMETLVFCKFDQNPLLRRKLLDTQDCFIQEGNTWGDTYWGVFKGDGQNHLGKILMNVRTKLREQESES